MIVPTFTYIVPEEVRWSYPLPIVPEEVRWSYPLPIVPEEVRWSYPLPNIFHLLDILHESHFMLFNSIWITLGGSRRETDLL